MDLHTSSPSPVSTLPSLASGRRSGKPPVPSLHLVISDRMSGSGRFELDSGYHSAVSVKRPSQGSFSSSSASPAPTNADSSSPLSVLMPTPDDSIFATTDPFATTTTRQTRVDRAVQDQHQPQTSGSRNVKKLSLLSLDSHPPPQSQKSLRSIPSNLSIQSVAPSKVPMSLPTSPNLSKRKLSLRPPPLPITTTLRENTSSSSQLDDASTSDLPSRRRPSIVSLPPTQPLPSNPARSHYITGRRAIEDDEDADPYVDGPVEVLPGVWLGAEENARDWEALARCSIGAILNVAKEVVLPFEESDAHAPMAWQSGATAVATGSASGHASTRLGNQFPANGETGRPDLVYLHLPWSHGQNDLVQKGFVDGMEFIDRCVAANIGVLIHCQCGISRSATMAIAYVMRLAYDASAPADVANLRKEGMQGAYNYLKSKSQTIGPNMSLIYQLLEYEKFLKARNDEGLVVVGAEVLGSEPSSIESAEAEWTRQRLAMEIADAKAEAEASASASAAEGSSTRATSPEHVSPDDENMLSDGTTAIEAAEARELDLRMLKRRESREYNNQTRSSSRASSSRAPSSTRGPFGTRARGMSVGSDMSFASTTGTGGLMSGDSLLIEEDEDDFDDSPYSLSRKSSSIAEDDEEMGDVGDETFVQLPTFNRSPPPVLLPPLSFASMKRGSQSSYASSTTLENSSLAPSPAESRRASNATFFLPPPSARPDQAGFKISGDSTLLAPSPAFGRRRSGEKPPPLVLPSSRGSRPAQLFLDNETQEEATAVNLSPPPLPVVVKEPQPTAFVSSPLQISMAVQPEVPDLEMSSSISSQSSIASSSRSRSSSSSSIDRKEGIGAPSKRTTYRNKTHSHRATMGSAPYSTATPETVKTPSHQTLFVFPPSPPRYRSVLTTTTTDGGNSSATHVHMVQVPPTPSRMIVTTTTPQSNSRSSRSPSHHSLSRSRSRSRARGSRQASEEFESAGSLGSSPSNSSILGGLSSSRSTSTSSIVSGFSVHSTASLSRRRKRGSPPLSSGITPTVASFRHRMRHGHGADAGAMNANMPTPTTATTHVEARGWVTSSASVVGMRSTSTEVLSPLSTPLTARPS